MGEIIGIVCVDRNWGIGYKNNLLFNIPEDMKFFKEKTQEQIVCMGYKTLLSLPFSKPLSNRTNIVLTSKNIDVENCLVVHSTEELLEFIADKTVYIIGGGKVYHELLPYYTKIYVTHVAAEKPADTFFPNLLENGFTKVAISDIINTDCGKIQFFEYTRN